MKIITGIAIGMIAAAAWAQSDSELTPRQIFDYGMKAPAAVKPASTPRNPPAGKPKPADAASVKPADVAPVKPPVDGTPVTPSVETASDRTPKAPDNVTHVRPAGYTPLALRYSILQKKGNAYVEVDADTEFHTGDHVRVKVEANTAAYLYIVMYGSSNQWHVLFPDKDIDGGNNRIQQGQPCTIPSDDGSFYFDETAGAERVSLVLSRTPEQDLEKLIYETGDPTRTDEQRKLVIARNNVDDSVMGGVREKLLSRDLVFEKNPTDADGHQEKAVYAATRDKSPDARLFVDLKLTHK